ALGVDVFIDEALLRERRAEAQYRGLDAAKSGRNLARQSEQGIARLGQELLGHKPAQPDGFQPAAEQHITGDAGRAKQLRRARSPGPRRFDALEPGADRRALHHEMIVDLAPAHPERDRLLEMRSRLVPLVEGLI